MPTMIERWMAKGQGKSVILFLATRFGSVPETLETRVKAIQKAEFWTN